MTDQKHTYQQAYAYCGRHVFFAMLLTIFGKLIYINASEGGELRNQAENYTIQKMTIDAQRGNIFSADGKLLAISMPVYNLYMDPTSPSDENFSENIAALGVELSKAFKNRNAKEWTNFHQSEKSTWRQIHQDRFTDNVQ